MLDEKLGSFDVLNCVEGCITLIIGKIDIASLVESVDE